MSINQFFPSRIDKVSDSRNKYWILFFLAYLVFFAVVVYRHEPWMDEAQAWLLAKDAGISELFLKYLRYEGSPGLWHLILMIPAKLGFPYFSLNILSLIFSACGVWLFIRYSPFTPLIKILFPFSYFAFYQFGVVARSYCLIPPLLFLIAINYEKRLKRPALYILLLALLANISAHTLLISCALLFIYLLDLLKIWKQLDKDAKIRQAIPVALFGVMLGLLYLVIVPPPDHLVAGPGDWRLMTFLNVSKWAIATALVVNEWSSVLWLEFGLAFVIFTSTLIWLRRTKLLLLYLTSLFPLLVLFAVKYRNLWHEGIVFFLWFFVIWLSLAGEKARESPKLAKMITALTAIVLSVQIYWSFYAVSHDLFYNYSGSYQVAEYLKTNKLEDKKIYASGWKSIAVSPYFDDKIFYNHNKGSGTRFWFWSVENQTMFGYHQDVINDIANEQPDIVIFASDHIDPTVVIELEGYRRTEFFEGNIFWKTGIYEADSYLIFRKEE